MRALLVCTALFATLPALAAPPGSVVGEYFLAAPREVRSAIRLGPDARFEYFRTEPTPDGPRDVSAWGRWRRDGDEVVLDTDRQRAGAPFTLASHARGRAGHVEVTVRLPDGRPAPGIVVRLETAAGPVEGATPRDGRLTLPSAAVREIVLLHPAFPALAGHFHGRPGENRYRFRLNPEPFRHAVFSGERLRVDDDRLIWPDENGGAFIYQRAPAKGVENPS